MQYITLHAVVPTASLEIATQHVPYPVAGTFELREGMTYRDLHTELDAVLSEDVSEDNIDELVRDMVWDDNRANAGWDTDVYALQPFDNTYSVIVTGEY
jgi:hypothetical protein